MKFITAAMCCISLFVVAKTHALEDSSFDSRLYHKALRYNPISGKSYYCRKIPTETFLQFLKIYEKRPISVNMYGMRSHGNFFLWYFLKKMNPYMVIESGVYRGQSTWTIEQAAPKAKVISIDIDLSQLAYRSPKVTYTTQDFSKLAIHQKDVAGPIVCFFDDHVNAFERVVQAAKKGIKYLIFDDNYPASNEKEIYHLTLSNCFEMEQFKDKAEVLKKLIKNYYIMPQIVGTESNHPVCDKLRTNLPAIWNSLDGMNPSIRGPMKIFADDSREYRWITFVELN